MFISSPYPWHYTLRWPFYFTWPSMRNHTNMPLVADQKSLVTQTACHLKLIFCGDIMTLNKDTVPSLHPKLCDLIKSADYFIGNCEAVVGHHLLNNKAKYGFIFHMPRAYLENIMQQTGLPASRWLLSTANNHIGDIDMKALQAHYAILSDMGVTPLGQYQEKNLPLQVIVQNGLRIGFIAWTEWMNRDIFSKRNAGVYRREHILCHDWRKIKSNLQLNYLFGLPHWEYEFQHFPHGKTRQLARHLIDDLGIDFLVGAHTHTLQPFEIFQSGICAYNLGNFAGQGRAWSVKLNSLLEVNLNANAATPLLSYKLHYFYQQHTSEGIHIIPIEEAPLKEQIRLTHLISKLFRQ